MRTALTISSIIAVVGSAASAQVIYSNGPFSTGPTTLSGVAAPAGFTWSEVANDSPTSANSSAGSTSSLTTGTTGAFRLADDFVIPAGQNWSVTSFTTYGYQTGSAATALPITGGSFNIWNARPGDVGAAIIGTAAFGVMTNTNVYRIFNTVAPPPGSVQGTTRQVRQVDWPVTGGSINLGPGTYWIDFQYTTVGTIFTPTVTIPGVRTLPGWNGRQLTTVGWTDSLDAGLPATIPDVANDFPFLVNGVPAPGSVALLAFGGMFAMRRRRN
jgi:hypothetical protein